MKLNGWVIQSYAHSNKIGKISNFKLIAFNFKMWAARTNRLEYTSTACKWPSNPNYRFSCVVVFRQLETRKYERLNKYECLPFRNKFSRLDTNSNNPAGKSRRKKYATPYTNTEEPRSPEQFSRIDLIGRSNFWFMTIEESAFGAIWLVSRRFMCTARE